MARKSGKGRAKGGGVGKTRQYVRDSNGRFASTPGGGKKAAAKPAARPKAKPAAKTPAKPKAPPKTTTARGRARTRAAEARKALRAGAGTRAARSLAIAQKAADYYKATGTGTKRKPTRAAAKPRAARSAMPSNIKARPGQTLRAEKRATKKLYAAGQSLDPRSNRSLAVTRKAMEMLRQVNASLPTPKKKRIKTDKQILAQVKKISEKAYDRNKSLSERTLTRLEGAASRVETRAQNRQNRANANIIRIESSSNRGARKNRNRSLAQQSAKWKYSQLRQDAHSVTGLVRQYADLTAFNRQSNFAKSKEGKKAKRKEREARNQAAKQWARNRR